MRTPSAAWSAAQADRPKRTARPGLASPRLVQHRPRLRDALGRLCRAVSQRLAQALRDPARRVGQEPRMHAGALGFGDEESRAPYAAKIDPREIAVAQDASRGFEHLR